jgi:hypothetical protein
VLLIFSYSSVQCIQNQLFVALLSYIINNKDSYTWPSVHMRRGATFFFFLVSALYQYWFIDAVEKKVCSEMNVADLKASTCSWAQLFLFRSVNPAALPLVRCYSIRHPRMVAIAEWTTAKQARTESCTVGTTPVISAFWRLKHYDVKNSGVWDRPHDLYWIRKRVCYPLHYTLTVHLSTQRIVNKSIILVIWWHSTTTTKAFIWKWSYYRPNLFVK